MTVRFCGSFFGSRKGPLMLPSLDRRRSCKTYVKERNLGVAHEMITALNFISFNSSSAFMPKRFSVAHFVLIMETTDSLLFTNYIKRLDV